MNGLFYNICNYVVNDVIKKQYHPASGTDKVRLNTGKEGKTMMIKIIMLLIVATLFIVALKLFLVS